MFEIEAFSIVRSITVNMVSVCQYGEVSKINQTTPVPDNSGAKHVD